TQRIHKLATEHLAAAAIVSQRRERAQHGQIAYPSAEVALQRPEGRDHRCRNAILTLGALEDRPVALHGAPAGPNAMRRGELPHHLEEGLGEEALAPVPDNDA